MRPIRWLLAVSFLAAPAAWAETYADIAAGTTSVSDNIRGQDFGGWNAFLGGRYDLPARYPPFFFTGDLYMHRLSSNNGASTDDGLGRYDVGAGYGFQPNYCTELYVRAEYFHFKQTSESASNNYAVHTDGAHAAVGAYYWVNDWLRPYAEAGWIRESRGIDGPRVSAGLELNVVRYVRPFVDYSYTSEDVPAGRTRYSAVSLGIKIPLQ